MAPPDASIHIVQFESNVATALHLRDLTLPIDDRNARLETTAAGGLATLFASTDPAQKIIYTILPRHEATLRILTLPSQDSRELAAMVELAAPDLVPYPIAEMRLSHQILNVLPSGESQVLVVLAQRSLIDGHLASLAALDIEPSRIFLSTACLVATAAQLDGTGNLSLLQIESGAIELVVMRNGKLQFSRGVATSAPLDLDIPESREILLYEVRDLLAAHRREDEFGRGDDTIYVSTNGLDAAETVRLIGEETGRNCRPVPTPPGELSLPATFSGAIRILRGECPIDIALAPAHIGRKQAQKLLTRRLIHFTTLASIILLALLLWFVQAVWQRTALIAELQQQIDVVSPSAQGVAAKQHSLQIISRQVDRGGSFLEILAGIADAAPPADLNVTRIEFDRESGLTLWGRAKTKDLILHDFLGAMRKEADGNLAIFASAHSLYETEGTERNESIFNYQIAVPVLDEEVAHANDPTPP